MQLVLSTVVIGAGQAGLSAAHHLSRLGLTPGEEFLVVDANVRAGGAWQHRWSSLTMADCTGWPPCPS